MVGDSLHQRNGHHEKRIGLFISKKLRKSLIGQTLLGSSLLKARFNSESIKVTVVGCYSHHNTHDAEEKDDFYQQLQAAVETFTVHDMLSILGDLNAQTVPDSRGKER